VLFRSPNPAQLAFPGSNKSKLSRVRLTSKIEQFSHPFKSKHGMKVNGGWRVGREWERRFRNEIRRSESHLFKPVKIVLERRNRYLKLGLIVNARCVVERACNVA